MIYSSYGIQLRATKIDCNLNGNELETYASIYPNIQTTYRSSCSQVTEWLFYRFCKIPGKATAVESYFSTATGHAILLKEDPTMGVFMKTFRTATSKFIDNSHSSCPLFPALLVCREGKGKFRILILILTSLGFYVRSPPG